MKEEIVQHMEKNVIIVKSRIILQQFVNTNKEISTMLNRTIRQSNNKTKKSGEFIIFPMKILRLSYL